jgi:hypothetical protein
MGLAPDHERHRCRLGCADGGAKPGRSGIARDKGGASTP